MQSSPSQFTQPNAASRSREGRGPLKNFQQQTYEILLERILNCVPGYTPGSRLDLHALSDELGISIVPIKESLRLLQAEGLVDIFARSGTYVAALDHQGLDDLVDFLRELELAALRLARQRPEAPDLGPLRKSVVESEKEIGRRRVSESITSNMGFHGELVALSGNQRLLQLYGSPRAYLLITVYRASDPQIRRHLLAQHRSILEALEAGDWAQAETAVASHWEDTRHHAHTALDLIAG